MYLTPEESALIHHVRHKHSKSMDLYQSLQPNPELSSSVLTASWATPSQLDKSKRVHHKRKKEIASRDENLSTYVTSSEKNEDSVTISYGSDAVTYTMNNGNMGVSPLKRAKVHGKRSFLTESTDKLSDSIASDFTKSEENPPPLPPRIQKPPPLPPRIKQEEPPPPVPQHRGGPRPPPRGASARNDAEETIAPPPPPKTASTDGLSSVSSPTILQQHTSFIYQDDISDEVMISSSPYSSLDPPITGKVPSEDSDVSERFATPPLTSPRSEERDLSTDASLPLSQSHSYRTPLGESFADDNHALSSPAHKAADLPILETMPSDDTRSTPSPTSPMYHDSFEITPQDDETPPFNGRGSNTSGLSLEQLESKEADVERVTSDHSLLMTKGVSEAGSATSSALFNTSIVGEEDQKQTLEDGKQQDPAQENVDKGQEDDHTCMDNHSSSPQAPPTTNHSEIQAPSTGNEVSTDNDSKVQTPIIAPAPPTYKEVTGGSVTGLDEADGDRGDGGRVVRYNTAMPQRIIPVDKSLTKASSEGDLRDMSPVPQELAESTSDEEGFYSSMQVRGKSFSVRPRAETFIGLKTRANVSTPKVSVSSSMPGVLCCHGSCPPSLIPWRGRSLWRRRSCMYRSGSIP